MALKSLAQRNCEAPSNLFAGSIRYRHAVRNDYKPKQLQPPEWLGTCSLRGQERHPFGLGVYGCRWVQVRLATHANKVFR
jgi:hypothetical protein